MKRFFAILIAISMMLTALTSCGGREKFDMSTVSSLSDLSGSIIAAQGGTFHIEALTAQASGVDVREYPDFTQLLIALNSGVIDGYVAEEPTAYAVIAQNPGLSYIPLKNNVNGFTATDADTGIAVAFRTGSPYVADVNIVLNTIDTATREALMQQVVKMSADPDTDLGEPIALASSKTVTNSSITLKIAMECAYAPFNWSQTTDANGAVKIANGDLYANGYDVQIAKYIAQELGVNLEIYAADWESLISGVQSGTYDAIIAGMSPTEEREAEVDFTDCYYNSNLVIIYKKAN